MKRSLNLVSSILKAPCNDLARGFFLSASRLFYRIALIYYQFTFGDTALSTYLGGPLYLCKKWEIKLDFCGIL